MLPDYIGKHGSLSVALAKAYQSLQNRYACRQDRFAWPQSGSSGASLLVHPSQPCLGLMFSEAMHQPLSSEAVCYPPCVAWTTERCSKQPLSLYFLVCSWHCV